MIDLSYKPRKTEQEEASLGKVILAVMPFVIAFWALIERGLR